MKKHQKYKLFFFLGATMASNYVTAEDSALKQQAIPEASSATLAQVKFVPQRADDIAWENDRIAFRIYGPALEKKNPTGSGIDVWVKSVAYPVIEKWYKHGHYHEDSGEGLDFYGVGQSRGCGGLGIWNGKSLAVSGHWQSYQIQESGGERSVFVIRYAPWKILDGREVSEERTFTLERGSNLNRLTSVFTSDLPELVVGIGIAKNRGGQLHQDKENGIMAFWPPDNPKHGRIGQAVLVPPQSLVGFAEDKLNYLLLVRVQPGIPFTYYAGACWDRRPEFSGFDAWKAYLEKQTMAKSSQP